MSNQIQSTLKNRNGTTKKLFHVILAMGILFSFISCNKPKAATQPEDVSGVYYDWTKTMQPERPWVRDYDKTLVMKLYLCSPDAEGNVGKVHQTFESALEVIRKLDKLTLGLPKIIYLVGWQYSGHDSKYPAWGEVNAALKSDHDFTALESLRRLIREARSYHTTVSLHINMFDAYKNSPLWKEYLANDIIAKDKNGNPIAGETGSRYNISYAQEWKTGYAQKRIDGLISMIPELKEGGTIHIDAFHSMRPLGIDEPVSPYLDFTIEDEMAAQRKIMRYWRTQGIDVTAEGYMDHMRRDPFIGLQAMAWWYRESSFVNDTWLGKPEGFSSLPPQFCTFTPMHAEEEIIKDPEFLTGLPEQFCRDVVPWYYKRNADAAVDTDVIITDGLVVCPVLWKDKTLVAYSKEGTSAMLFKLPTNWVDCKKVQLYGLSIEGLQPGIILEVNNGMASLDIPKGQPMVIMPIEQN